jgi:hypothetical protein
VEYNGGTFYPHPTLLTIAKGSDEAEEFKWVHNRWIARGFIKRADPKRFAKLHNNLKNFYARGTDQYPNDMAGAYAMLSNINPTSHPK